MINWNDVFHSIKTDRDYTVQEIRAMGVDQHAIYRAMKRGDLQRKGLFGKIYVSGKNLKEYVAKGIDKV